jgi:hypothetical protein
MACCYWFFLIVCLTTPASKVVVLQQWGDCRWWFWTHSANSIHVKSHQVWFPCCCWPHTAGADWVSGWGSVSVGSAIGEMYVWRVGWSPTASRAPHVLLSLVHAVQCSCYVRA